MYYYLVLASLLSTSVFGRRFPLSGGHLWTWTPNHRLAKGIANGTARQTDRQTDGQTDGRTDRQRRDRRACGHADGSKKAFRPAMAEKVGMGRVGAAVDGKPGVPGCFGDVRG